MREEKRERQIEKKEEKHEDKKHELKELRREKRRIRDDAEDAVEGMAAAGTLSSAEKKLACDKIVGRKKGRLKKREKSPCKYIRRR